MKFVLKRELRWLLFMLVPFVCFLVIHVMVPLFFVTQTTPLLQQSYNIEKKDLQFRTLYSFQQINQQIISARLIEYYKIFKSLNFLIEQDISKFISINTTSINFNNAYDITQKVANNQLSSTYIQPVSMWFAPNCVDYSDLTELQKYTYSRYSTVEPYIRSLVPINTSSSIVGIKTHLSTENQTIAFQYPSQYQQQFNQVNNSAFSDFDQLLIENYLTKNQTISVALQLNSVQPSIFSICTVLTDSNKDPYGVSCLNFDLNKLYQEMYEIINFAHSDYFKTSYAIIVPIISRNETTYVRAITINQTGGQIVTNQTMASSTIVVLSPATSSADTRITINGSSTTLFLGPLIIEQNFIQQSNILYLGSRNTYTFTSLANSTQFNNQISLTIGLVAGLVALASIISTIIMKTIMNNIDEELIELSNYCSYIIQDDLNIQIPSYNGTKDIQQVYETVKIINKLNKLSHPKYFTGHFINKILLYCQAQKFLKTINYDTGALLENIGNSYFYMQEVDKTIQYYKESVRCILTKIRGQFGTIDQIFQWKQQQFRLPKIYREYEIILIRRLFNLIEAFNCLLECHMAKDIKENQNQLIKDILDYIDLFKKAVYPDYHMYAEFLLVLFYQIKMKLYKGNVDAAQKILLKAEALSEAYINSYADIGKKLKEKGSKNKLLHMKNKITSHSRMHPQKIKTFRCYFRALVLLKTDKLQNKYEALNTLFQGTKVGIFSNRVTWMIFKQIHNILQFCNISQEKLFTLSIYNQICPLKNIEEKQFHSQNCPYRYPSQIPKQEQEYIYVIDCLANSSSQSQNGYFQDRGIHIYEKYIKDIDRVSIIKFHTPRGIKIECNLTMKESKQQILRKQISSSFQQKGSYRIQNQLFEAFRRVVHRIMKLRSEKIILFFFQSISKYQSNQQYLKKRQRSKMKMSTSMPLDDTPTDNIAIPDFTEFGNWVLTVINQSGIQKCKICFICSENDKLQQFRSFFGLNKINRRLWKVGKGVNINQNSIYIIEDHHKTDLDRILSKRLYAIPDNHIFIL